MKDKYKKFYMMFDKRFKNLILCSNLNCDGGVRSTQVSYLISHTAGVSKITKILIAIKNYLKIITYFVNVSVSQKGCI